MANKKISELPAVTTPNNADLVPVVQSGVTDQITRGNFLKNTDADMTTSDVTTNNASTSKHGFAPKATAPSSGIRNAVVIDNGETVYKNAALFDNTNPADLGTAGPGTSLLAARRDHVHNAPAGDASAVTFTPADNTKWDSSADPGNVDDALDQLADRVKDIEGGAVGGSDGDAIHDNVSGEIAAITEKTTPVANDLVVIEDSESSNAKKRVKLSNLATGIGSSPNRDYFTYLAARLEPDAIEFPQKGTFTYTIGSGETKIILNSYWTKIGSAGRHEVRNAGAPLILRNCTMAGLDSTSYAVIADPSLPTYTDAEATYYGRLATLATMTPKTIQVNAASGNTLWLPGPYGSIILGYTMFNYPWMGVTNRVGTGFNFADEIDDATTVRFADGCYIAVNKMIANAIVVGSGSSQDGGIIWTDLPSNWSKVTDPNTYIFRDDFLGATLDTSTKWTRAQSTAGNVEIDSTWAWLRLKGNANWGTNGCFSQTTTSRVAGKQFICDVYIAIEADVTKHNVVVGWHDGSGQSYADFSHGLDFSTTGGVRRLLVFEDSNYRGEVGANPGYTEGHVYRVRITLGASSATYEIQGGPEYHRIGDATWDDITPGVTSSSTTPLAIGATKEAASSLYTYISDMRMIS